MAYNKCAWLLLGKTELCGRDCWGKYCGILTKMDFIDAEEMARLHPKAFAYPDTTNLQVGELVKLCNGRERFWVLLTAIDDNSLTGTIDNQLVDETGYNFGDMISFGKQHVYQVWV